MQEKDYYEILQVSPNAEPEVIQAAYRRLARKYHPDVDKSPQAAERMKEINAAYDILRDPAKRAAYDRLRERISAPPRYRREAPPEPERPRVPTIQCQNCGRIDNTLRLAGFLYVYSILIMSFRRGAGGLLCSSCRRTEAIKYSLVTLLFGWWGIPWGIFWSLQALGTNLFGGKQPAKENAQLLRLLALQFMAANQILNAVQALKDSLSLERDPKTEEFLQHLEASPEFKAAKQQSERRAEVEPRPPSFLRRNWPVIVGTFIGIFLCAMYAVFAIIPLTPPPAPLSPTPAKGPPPPTPTPTWPSQTLEGDPVKGSPDAAVTIIEYTDYQCPFCTRFVQETLPLIEENYIATGKVRLIFRNFPVHEQAVFAAGAAVCAQEGDEFWQMHDTLFAQQTEWSGNSDFIALFEGYAQDIGLDTEQFISCLIPEEGKEPEWLEKLKKDFETGVETGVEGTPSFSINDQLVVGAQPFEVFQEVIEQELAK